MSNATIFLICAGVWLACIAPELCRAYAWRFASWREDRRLRRMIRRDER